MSPSKSYSPFKPLNFLINGTLGIFDVLKAGFESVNILNSLGSITFLLLFIQILTGFVLSFFYMPSLDQAQKSIMYIMSDKIPYGLFIRTLHRYAADAMILFAAAHMLRKLFAQRHTSTRSVGWFVGVALLVFTVLITITGYILPMDGRASEILKFFGRGQITEVALLVIYRAFHIGAPILVFALLVWHFARISRPPVIPTFALSLIFLGVLAVIVGLFPIAGKTDLKAGKYVFDWIGLFTIRLGSPTIAASAWGFLIAVLIALPFFGRKIKTAAVVDPVRCSGCFTCITLCPKNAITQKKFNISRNKTKDVAFVVRKKCQACGICVAGCLPQVIDLEGFENKVILEEVKGLCLQ
ncbi:MAG TPA: cytochrome b N-terminal domain-containing protein [Caldisericia bacterium]|nr:MAG: Cytochrome b6 [bacterium ADurb.Bin132]HNY60987.1 cytochrome b N-terminal domain-containing protein [Caldisericia bacterium]HOC78919.1 cytochrome b N-terminal domain-containing protein [Caldisericia bacterium]HOG69706.1 cytochrome b N-terminal domain-containing protein [Caldisericia bacterium]HPA65648.1 cytochrome b N-terminal domain-containing protein [Caldisericia bacterium]